MKIKTSISNSFSLLAILIIVSTILFVRLSNPPKNNLKYDVFGYYLYLPATFIYHDPGLKDKDTFDQLIEKYHPSPTFYQVNRGPKGYWMMKYSMGMAVLYSPAFFAGHLAALITEYPADGFSKPYQRALMYYNFLFTLIGLIVLRKVLLRFFPDNVAAAVMLLVYFGTNYFANSTYNAEMPHNYLFTLYALILWYTIKWHESFQLKYMIGLGLFVGLSTLARPTELVAVIIPVFWNTSSFSEFKSKFGNIWINYKSQLAAFILVLFLIGSIQVLYWFIYSGSLIYSGYRNPGEGFDFLWPYTLKFLFSFRKGWLIYTPLMFFSLWGLYLLWKRNNRIFLSIFIFFIVNIYIVSSWSNWWYAQSMGQRAMVQSYAVMSIPLGYAILKIARFSILKRALIYCLIIFVVALNIFQTWQIRYEIISRDRMTFAYYLKSFGNMEKDPEIEKYLLINRAGGGGETMPAYRTYSNKILNLNDFENTEEKFIALLSDSIKKSGRYSLKMNHKVKYAAKFSMPFKEITDNYYAWIRTSVWVYPVHDIAETPVRIVVSFQHDGKDYKLRPYRIEDADIKNRLIPHQWNKISYDYLTPEVRSKDDRLVVFLWNLGEKEIYFDDLMIEAFEEE